MKNNGKNKITYDITMRKEEDNILRNQKGVLFCTPLYLSLVYISSIVNLQLSQIHHK